jgi:hypothetical protein
LNPDDHDASSSSCECALRFSDRIAASQLNEVAPQSGVGVNEL